jgi:hypothetical protein
MKLYCRCESSATDIDPIRNLIRDHPAYTRADLSRLTYRALQWYKPNGGLKEMACRVAMLRMQDAGLIELPPPRHPKSRCHIQITPRTDPQVYLGEPVCPLLLKICPPCEILQRHKSLPEGLDKHNLIEGTKTLTDLSQARAVASRKRAEPRARLIPTLPLNANRPDGLLVSLLDGIQR